MTLINCFFHDDHGQDLIEYMLRLASIIPEPAASPVCVKESLRRKKQGLGGIESRPQTCPNTVSPRIASLDEPNYWKETE